jgi:hypothetical protein
MDALGESHGTNTVHGVRTVPAESARKAFRRLDIACRLMHDISGIGYTMFSQKEPRSQR